MRRPWETFTVVEHQIAVQYVLVLRRSRGVLVAEIGTEQKYPQLLGYTGSELLLSASEHTHKDRYDPAAAATSVIFPRALRGWNTVAEMQGRYSLRFALYKPPRRNGPSAVTRKDEAWRVAWLASTRK